VHVYAFSMAANVLLSFFPFLIVMVSICRHVLGWAAAESTIFLALETYFPGELGLFIQRNLKATVAERGAFQLLPVLLLLFTANGIFEPLEVALNRAWGITKNRSYFRNQLISLGLIFMVGSLILISLMLTAFNQEIWLRTASPAEQVSRWMNVMFYRMAAVPISMVVLFLIYWLLPNGKIPARRLIPVSILVGGTLEVLKYATTLLWPIIRAKLNAEYGPFYYSVTIVLWSFVASLIVLMGADWAARETGQTTPAAELEKLH